MRGFFRVTDFPEVLFITPPHSECWLKVHAYSLRRCTVPSYFTAGQV